MTIIEKDLDLLANEGTHCSIAISRGYREIIDACLENPSIFMEIISRGTIKYESYSDFSVLSKSDISLTALNEVILSASKEAKISSGKITLSADDVAAISAKVASVIADQIDMQAKSFSVNGDQASIAAKSISLAADSTVIDNPVFVIGEDTFSSAQIAAKLKG